MIFDLLHAPYRIASATMRFMRNEVTNGNPAATVKGLNRVTLNLPRFDGHFEKEYISNSIRKECPMIKWQHFTSEFKLEAIRLLERG